MKKILSVVLTMAMLISCLAGLTVTVGASELYAGGTGVAGDPYIIENEVHFDNIRTNPTAVYKVVKDIDLTKLAAAYVPFVFSGELIGSDAENLKTVNVAITGNSGLFTQLSAGKIENIKLTGSVSGGASVGGFAGKMGAASIKNCINEADISGGNNIGGIVGESISGSAKITGCKNEGAISGNQGVGGIGGFFKGQVSKCVNNGTVDGSSHYAGGIVGLMNGGGISECYNMNTVTGRKNGGHAAGIVGGTNGTTELILSDCYNTGAIVHTFKTGACGIIGVLNTASKVSNCLNLTTGLNFPVASDFYAIRETEVIKNCYYISDDLIDDGFNGTTALTSKDFTDETKFTDLDSNIWVKVNGYDYLQLKNNPHPLPLNYVLYGGGNGVAGDPYIIENEVHFDNIRKNPAAVYEVANNIDLNKLAEAYVPFAFSGQLIGSDAENLKTVNIDIVSATADGYGLFTQLTAGKIENLKLTGSVDAKTNVGGFAGTMGAASITNCINAATVHGSYNNVGGIVGQSGAGAAKITGCKNEGAVSGNQGIGGIGGWFKGTISKCVNNGTVTAAGNCAGGIIGMENGGTVISECYNMNTVTGGNSGGCHGGIVGFDYRGGLTLSDCYNIGYVNHTFKKAACGIVGGLQSTSQVSNCLNLVEGLNYPISNGTGTVTNCYYISDALADDGFDGTTALTSSEFKKMSSFKDFSTSIWAIKSETGYFYPQLLNNPHPVTYVEIGSTADYPIVIDSYEAFETLRDGGEGKYYSVTANIEIPEGYEPFELKDAYLFGDDAVKLKEIKVNINKPESNNVGLFSKLSGLVQIKNLKVTGSVKGYDYVGGFAGDMGTITAGSIIDNCVNEANVSGRHNVGGIMGQNITAMTVSNLTNKGSISGNNNIGGIIGTSGNVTSCKNLGTISGADNIGGITGFAYGSAYECYNNGNVSGRKMVGGIIGSSNANGRTVKDSYNTGIITAKGSGVTENEIGGILGGMYTANKSFTVENCYNIGQIYSDTGSFNPIAPLRSDFAEGTIFKFVNCYYADPDKTDDGKDGTTAVAKDELKALATLGDKFAASTDNGYVYPQIVSNAQVADMEFFAVTAAGNDNLEITPCDVRYVKSGDSVTYEISANDNYMIDYISFGDAKVTDFYNKKYASYVSSAITSDITITFVEKDFEIPAKIDAVQVNFIPDEYVDVEIIAERIINTPYGICFSKVEEFNECELVEYGMILSKTNPELDMSSFDSIAPASGKGESGSFGVLFMGEGIEENKVYYTRAYAIYKKDGVSTIIMGTPSQFVTTAE